MASTDFFCMEVKFAHLVNSGSSANLLAFMALTAPELGERQIRPGDEVITVACSFPTTVSPMMQYGAVPVFVDVTIPQYNIDVTKVVVVNADLSGTCRNRDFVRRFPERSFNVGIAEQNMVSFAAGLSCEGFVPYVFSMAPFLTMRACEQCRTDVAYGNRSVRLMGVYAGVSGGISGPTHWAVEDCGIMASMPGMTVFEVSDAGQARRLLDYSLSFCGPMYVRCTVEPVIKLYPENVKVRSGGSCTVREGNDGAFLCSGVVVQYALRAAEQIFRTMGKQIRVVDLYSIKPLDEEAVISAAETGYVIVAQDHNIVGGLGSMVASTLCRRGIAACFQVLGVEDRFDPMAHAPFLYRKYGIDEEGLTAAMRKMICRTEMGGSKR